GHAKNQRMLFPQLSGLQSKAEADLLRLGFPTRLDEDWKYSSTQAFTQQFFVKHQREASPHQALPTLPFKAIMCDALSGVSATQALMDGVLVCTWAEALFHHAELVNRHLDQIATLKHGFHAQNTLMMSDGLFIYIPKGVVVSSPLYIYHPQVGVPNEANYWRHLIVAESDSAVTVIEDYVSDVAHAYYTNTLTEIQIAPRASVCHYKLQREGREAYHVGEVAARLNEHSAFESHSFSMGGRWVRSDTSIDLTAPFARCLQNGLYVAEGAQHVDHHTCVRHLAPSCSSTQDYRGILSGRGRAVFNGSVMVAVDAQHSDAKQQNKNLLLSSTAEIDTKPQLEIFANDVQCT
ncbi:MAG: hypothetical protein B7X00_01930, partial [Legionella sp. 21-45-4]